MSFYEEMPPLDKTILDIVSIGTAVATVTDILPAFAAIVTIVWTGIRIYETDTIQRLVGKKPSVKKTNSE